MRHKTDVTNVTSGIAYTVRVPNYVLSCHRGYGYIGLACVENRTLIDLSMDANGGSVPTKVHFQLLMGSVRS